MAAADAVRPLVLALLFLATSASAEVLWRPRATVEFGVDSFAQIYRLTDFASESLLAEESTLRTETDVFTELRGAAELGLRIGDDRREGDVRGRLSYGTDTVRGNAEARFDLRGQRDRLNAHVEIEGRTFRDDSDFSLNSDFGEFRSRAHWERAVNGVWNVGLRTRGAVTRYETPSSFEVDNERLDVSLTSSLRGDLGQWFDLEAGTGRRWADPFDDPGDPDVVPSVLAYDRFFGVADWVHDAGGRWRFGLSHWIERRDYDDEEQRSSLWNVLLEPEVQLRLDDAWSLRWRSAIDWLDYDTSSSTYYDLALGRTGLALLRRWRTFEWGVEPRISWLSAPVPSEDEFVQPSLVFSFDGFGGDRFFVSITEELGHRDYGEPRGDDVLGVYTDYWFLRSTVVASVQVVEGASFEFFLSDEPESHRAEEDDARLTLVSATVRVVF